LGDPLNSCKRFRPRLAHGVWGNVECPGLYLRQRLEAKRLERLEVEAVRCNRKFHALMPWMSVKSKRMSAMKDGRDLDDVVSQAVDDSELP
jgi:hypothetical protein